MRVLLVNDYYSKVGGSEVYFYNLANLLKSKGHEVYTLTFSNFSLFSKYSYVIKRPHSNFGKFLSLYFINPYVYLKLRKVVKEINPDIIHLNNIYENHYNIILSCIGYPVVKSVHDIRDIDVKYNKISPYITAKSKFFVSSRTIKAFISPSFFLKGKMEEFGYDKVVRLPHFIDFTKQIKLPDERKKIILYCGRLSEEKGVIYLLKSFESINKKIPYSRLYIVGDGMEKDNLARYVKSKSISNVTFCGKVDNLDIGKFYMMASVVVIRSIIDENLPLVALEAMSFSKPIIAFSVGGLKELVSNGKNGFLVSKGNVKLLSENIEKLLKNKGLAKKIGENGRKFIMEDQFSAEFHYSTLMGVYNGAINS